MSDWKKILVSPYSLIVNVIKLIDESSLQIALVVDENNRLRGTVTDGDIRRGILKGISLTEPVEKIMCQQPSVARMSDGRDNILALMKNKRLRQIPVVDETNHVLGLEVWDKIIQITERDNVVVLMAGGLGSRLGHLTSNCPKPLLMVGGKPVLETILENCRGYGFHKFFISVNYKAEMIKNYFLDGSRWRVKIDYITESKRLGTAGALGLLPIVTSQPLIVVNADLLTKVNFQQLLDFHYEHQAMATMCVREYDFQVPYGVVNIDKHRLIGIEEKPLQRFFVNAGIYVLEPTSLKYIPKNEFIDMPAFFEKLIERRHETIAFPIREYWLDIGRSDDYDRANGEYPEIFT